MREKEFLVPCKEGEDFSQHIETSIPGYSNLIHIIESIYKTIDQSNSLVIDVGTSQGDKLVRLKNITKSDNVEFLGIDPSDRFYENWSDIEHKSECIRFENRTLMECMKLIKKKISKKRQMSMTLSLFTNQFVSRDEDRESNIASISRMMKNQSQIYIHSEKVYLSEHRMNDTFSRLQLIDKLDSYNSDDILNKERTLHNIMRLWDRDRLEKVLNKNFSTVVPIWQYGMFVAYACINEG